MTTSPQDSPHSPQQGRAAFICTDVHRFSAGQDAGPVAQTCRAVLDGYGSGLSPLDARMLGRLVRLGDLIPEILANEARLMIAFGALRQVQVAFDNAENRDTERQPQSSVALQAVYRLLGLTWPAQS